VKIERFVTPRQPLEARIVAGAASVEAEERDGGKLCQHGSLSVSFGKAGKTVGAASRRLTGDHGEHSVCFAERPWSSPGTPRPFR